MRSAEIERVICWKRKCIYEEREDKEDYMVEGQNGPTGPDYFIPGEEGWDEFIPPRWFNSVHGLVYPTYLQILNILPNLL